MKKERFTESQIMQILKQAEGGIPVADLCREYGMSNASFIVSIVLACTTFGISETCYCYRPMRNDENEEIADWLLLLTACHKRWGFGLCFLYLRNVKGFGWNHKRVYRIYRELELNLRIKPRKRLKREKPEPLAVPERSNDTWSMDFMADQLSNGRSFRTFNVLDDFNREGLGNRSGRIASIRAGYARSGSDYRMARQTQEDTL